MPKFIEFIFSRYRQGNAKKIMFLSLLVVVMLFISAYSGGYFNVAGQIFGYFPINEVEEKGKKIEDLNEQLSIKEETIEEKKIKIENLEGEIASLENSVEELSGRENPYEREKCISLEQSFSDPVSSFGVSPSVIAKVEGEYIIQSDIFTPESGKFQKNLEKTDEWEFFYDDRKFNVSVSKLKAKDNKFCFYIVEK